MQLYRRPKQPATFPRSWETARQKAERLIETLLNKSEGSVPPPETKKPRRRAKQKGPAKKLFPELWKDYKPLFAYAQFEKCGFCESKITSSSHGDVEHYRPKSEISELGDDPFTYGHEREASAAIKGRQVTLVCSTGYYWLAYDWSNYLLACQICNSTFKGTIFPVRDGTRNVPPLKTHPADNALLLNPFDQIDPALHLEFRPDGFVLPKTQYGRATIDTCGLYRTSLSGDRGKIALRVYELADELRKPPRRRKNSQVIRDLYEKGNEESEFSGMVRCIIREICNVSWEELVKKRAKELALLIKKTRNSERRNAMDEDMEKMGRERYEYHLTVRRVFEKTCGLTWAKLVSRRMHQLAVDFNDLRIDWGKHSYYELDLKKKIYLMARDNPGHEKVMQEAYEKTCKMDWSELRALVETQYDLLWRLPEEKSE